MPDWYAVGIGATLLPMSNAPTSSLFDSILADAAVVSAPAPVAVESTTVTLPDFRPFSDRTAPSDGFHPQAIVPATKVPYSYQWAAVESLLLFSRAILGFEPGMGKTLIAQTVVANLVAQGRKVLVVVPPSLRVDPWEREFAAEFPQLRVRIVEGRKVDDRTAEKLLATSFDPDADVTIIGDATLADRTDDIIEWGASALVVDEAHRFKSPVAKRSKALQQLVDDAETAHRVLPEEHPAPFVAMLTGTLAMNRPDEVYQPARITGKSTVNAISGADSYSNFVRRWCEQNEFRVNGRKIFQTVGCKDPEGLHEKLRETCYLRTAREDVLDMPEKVWAVHGLTLEDSVLRTYRRIETEFLSWIAEQMGADAAERAAKGEAIVKLQKLWAEAASAKAKAAAEYVADLVEQGEQVVVMGHHRDAIEKFHDELRTHKVRDGIRNRPIRAVEVVGGMGDKAKIEARDAFQAGKAEVLIGNIEAAGVGMDLDAAHHLVFIQLPWAPGSMVQAGDRIYRPASGGTDPRTIHVLNALDTVDERMYLQLQAKAAVTDRLNGGEVGISIRQDLTVTGEVLASYGWVTDYS